MWAGVRLNVRYQYASVLFLLFQSSMHHVRRNRFFSAPRVQNAQHRANHRFSKAIISSLLHCHGFDRFAQKKHSFPFSASSLGDLPCGHQQYGLYSFVAVIIAFCFFFPVLHVNTLSRFVSCFFWVGGAKCRANGSRRRAGEIRNTSLTVGVRSMPVAGPSLSLDPPVYRLWAPFP